jgi:hypothetical protein
LESNGEEKGDQMENNKSQQCLRDALELLVWEDT